VDMTQVRDEPFAVNTAADSDQSKADGSFCIRYIRPAKYLLTAERLDVKDYIRWAGYYPGVAKRSQAKMIEVHGGDNLADLQFSVGKVRVHTVLFHIVSADGSLLPLKNLGVSFDAPERDALAYHLTQTRNINGEFPAGYVPPGNYLVQTYVPEDRKDPGGTVALAHGQARNVYRNGFGDRPYAESRELDFTRSSLSLSGKKFSPRRRAVHSVQQHASVLRFCNESLCLRQFGGLDNLRAVVHRQHKNGHVGQSLLDALSRRETIANGKQAVEKAIELNYDLIILDVAMPVLAASMAASTLPRDFRIMQTPLRTTS